MNGARLGNSIEDFDGVIIGLKVFGIFVSWLLHPPKRLWSSLEFARLVAPRALGHDTLSDTPQKVVPFALPDDRFFPHSGEATYAAKQCL